MPNMIGDEFAVGLSELFGVAWWNGDGRTVGTHHDGAVPIERVHELVGFQPRFERLPYAYAGDSLAPVMISHPTNGYLLGVNSSKYPFTGYGERLIDGIVKLTDQSEGELIISSAGILSGGRQAFVQIALGDPAVHAATGEQFSEWLLAFSSLDTTLPTGFQRGVTRVVCRNTFQAFRAENGQKYAYKNTMNGGLHIAHAREVLSIFAEMGEDLFAQLEREINTPVSDAQWEAILDELYPIPEKAGRLKTTNENIHIDLSSLYYADSRVGFTGTAWGAFQALSTWKQHDTNVRQDQTSLGRNMAWTMDGDLLKFDQKSQAAIEKVLATV